MGMEALGAKLRKRCVTGQGKVCGAGATPIRDLSMRKVCAYRNPQRDKHKKTGLLRAGLLILCDSA